MRHLYRILILTGFSYIFYNLIASFFNAQLHIGLPIVGLVGSFMFASLNYGFVKIFLKKK